jgi:hypothetical protein
MGHHLGVGGGRVERGKVEEGEEGGCQRRCWRPGAGVRYRRPSTIWTYPGGRNHERGAYSAVRRVRRSAHRPQRRAPAPIANAAATTVPFA